MKSLVATQGREQLNPEGPADLVLDKGYHSNDSLVLLKESRSTELLLRAGPRAPQLAWQAGGEPSGLPEPAADRGASVESGCCVSVGTGGTQFRSYVRNRGHAKNPPPVSRQHHQAPAGHGGAVQSQPDYEKTVGVRNTPRASRRTHCGPCFIAFDRFACDPKNRDLSTLLFRALRGNIKRNRNASSDT